MSFKMVMTVNMEMKVNGKRPNVAVLTILSTYPFSTAK